MRRTLHTGANRLAKLAEPRLVETLMSPPKGPTDFISFRQEIRRLRQSESKKQYESDWSRNKPQTQLNVERNPDPSVSALMAKTDVTGRDISRWLHTHVKTEKITFDSQSKVEGYLLQMIDAANPTSLRALMQYLAQYWEAGWEGTKPLIRVAKQQAQLVLTRALKIHRETTYVTIKSSSVPQIGIPDFEKFERFVASLYIYMELGAHTEGPLEPVSDALVRLVARCGPLNEALDRVLTAHLSRRLLSEGLIDEFAAAYDRKLRAEALIGKHATDYQEVTDLFRAQQKTPQSVKFLLNWSAQSLQEMWELAETARTNADIWAEAQLDFVNFLEKHCQDKVLLLGHMFALLARIAAAVPLDAEVQDRSLLLALDGGPASIAGAFQYQTESVAEATMQKVLERLERLNITASALSQLAHLIKPEVTPALQAKYEMLLSRCK